MSRRALVSGATGLIGRALLAELLAAREGAQAGSGPLYTEVHALRRGPATAVPPLTDARLHWHSVNFESLPALPAVDDACIALGTTIKVAGSPAAFKAVDLDAVLACARAARAAGATRLVVVSALGADPRSSVFYNRIKGEMEAALPGMGFDSVVIAQPSLLLGDRAALGQPVRRLEHLASTLLRPLLGLVPANVRPIEAEVVARALVTALQNPAPGVKRLVSAQLQRLGRQAAG